MTALNDSLDGPRVTISGGTLCAAEIVTRWQAPITLLLPSLRKGLGMREQLFPNRHGSHKGTSGETEARPSALAVNLEDDRAH